MRGRERDPSNRCGEIFFLDQTIADEGFWDTMTTTEPAWYRTIECEEEPFPKRTAVIEEGPGIEEKCGGFLLEGLADTDHMAGDYGPPWSRKGVRFYPRA